MPRHDGRIVAGSTSEEAGFDKRVTPEGIRQIFEAAVANLCPELASSEVLETWAGLRPGTPDDLPILGPTDIRGLLIATGHYRNGILACACYGKTDPGMDRARATRLQRGTFSPLRFIRPRDALTKNLGLRHTSLYEAPRTELCFAAVHDWAGRAERKPALAL